MLHHYPCSQTLISLSPSIPSFPLHKIQFFTRGYRGVLDKNSNDEPFCFCLPSAAAPPSPKSRPPSPPLSSPVVNMKVTAILLLVFLTL